MLSQLQFPTANASHYLCADDSFGSSASQLARQLRSEEYSIRHRLKSIEADRRFVEQFQSAYSTLRVHANLRCGLWYLSDTVATKAGEPCYFKSTDGHAHHCKFSDTRLNAHILRALLVPSATSSSAETKQPLAQAVAPPPGLLIIDSTRKGKRYPDSFSRTIPIWCAVWNRAIDEWRREHSTEKTETIAATIPTEWDTALHLPTWISPMEASQIESLLPGFVRTLKHSGVDLGEFAAGLRKPLRCLWMNTESRGWEHGDAEFDQLSFTPILLLQCSVPESTTRGIGQRQGWTYIQGAGDDEENWTKKGGIRGFDPRDLSELSKELSQFDREEDVVERIQEYLAAKGRKETPSSDGGGGAISAVAVHHVPAVDVLVVVDSALPSCVTVTAALSSASSSSSSSSVASKPLSLVHLHFDTTQQNLKLQRKQKLAADAERKFMRTNGDEDDEEDGTRDEYAGPSSESAAAAAPSISLHDWPTDHSLVLPISVQSKDKHALLDVLPSALAFLAAQSRLGRTSVLVCEDLAYSSCICTAALLQRQQQQQQRVVAATTSKATAGNSTIAASTTTAIAAATPAPAAPAAASAPVASRTIDKASIRAGLAVVQSSLPMHFPSRAMIKQLNQHFMQHRG